MRGRQGSLRAHSPLDKTELGLCAAGSSDPACGADVWPEYALPPPLWCQPELASAAFSPWGAVRAALVHALNDPEVGLNSSRVSDTFQDLDEYFQNGWSHRDDEELAEHFAVLDDELRALGLQAGTLRVSLCAALQLARVGKDFMHCALLIGAGAEGAPGRHAWLQVEAAAFHFVMRVASGGCRWPQFEARGNLLLLLRVVDEIIWCTQDWADRLAVLRVIFDSERRPDGLGR